MLKGLGLKVLETVAEGTEAADPTFFEKAQDWMNDNVGMVVCIVIGVLALAAIYKAVKKHLK